MIIYNASQKTKKGNSVTDPLKTSTKDKPSLAPYKAMLELNRRMALGYCPQGDERNQLVSLLLSAKVPGPVPHRKTGRQLGPRLFIPPDGPKLRTVLGQMPKSRILEGNMYELEILRLLCLLSPQDETVDEMRLFTLERLRHTCFGWEDDGVGECFDASLIVLRFLLAAAPMPSGEGWIRSRIENYKRHRYDRPRTWHSRWYYWLCVSEMPKRLQAAEAYSCRPELEHMLHEGIADCGRDKSLRPMLIAVLEKIALNWGYKPEIEFSMEDSCQEQSSHVKLEGEVWLK